MKVFLAVVVVATETFSRGSLNSFACRWEILINIDNQGKPLGHRSSYTITILSQL